MSDDEVQAQMEEAAAALEKHARLLRHFLGPPPDSPLGRSGWYRSCGIAAAHDQVKRTSARLARLYRAASVEEDEEAE